MTSTTKCYVTYTWYGGGGFDGFQQFGPVFLSEEQAKKWEDENEGEYHSGYSECELMTIGNDGN